MPSVQTRGTFLTITSLLLGASLLGAAAGGCAKNGDDGGDAASSATAGTSAAPAAAGGGSALVVAGKAVYAGNGCTRCHTIGGQGGRMGPDLSRTGAEASHTLDWLVAHVKDPKIHNPGSRMPGFAGKISDKDLLALDAYLAGLK